MAHPGVTAVHVVLPGHRPDWNPTGVTVRRGDRVTLLGSGRISWSPHHGAGARHHLRGRIAGGDAFGCAQDTTTVVAERSGPLELRVHLGPWPDTPGGALAVTVLHWASGLDPVAGLAALPPGAADPELAAAERERLLDPVVPPAGWSSLPGTGRSDVYRHGLADGRAAIDVVCDDNAATITRAVGVDLCPGATIGWSWRVRSLPAAVPENTRWTHDHLSIAALFDTGRQLAWFWSSSLAPDDDRSPARCATAAPTCRCAADPPGWAAGGASRATSGPITTGSSARRPPASRPSGWSPSAMSATAAPTPRSATSCCTAAAGTSRCCDGRRGPAAGVTPAG